MKQNDCQLNKTPDALLSLKGVGKTFVSDAGRQVPVLENIDLNIRAGELTTLVGTTGTGKSTLLNVIAGLCDADSGSVTPEPSLDIQNELAYVFQHYTLLPWRNVLKNVAFGLQLRNIPRPQRYAEAAALIEQVGLGGFEKAYPHELSGGMRQRAAIAQALATKPKLLLMDEPFGSLDDGTRADLQKMLIELHRQTHTSTLFVTHNIDEAIILADRIIVLGGRPAAIEADIAVDLPRPRHRTSQEFTELYMTIRNMITPREVKP